MSILNLVETGREPRPPWAVHRAHQSYWSVIDYLLR